MSGWLPPIMVREDLPEGWVFTEDAEGRLVPLFPWLPELLEIREDGDEVAGE